MKKQNLAINKLAFNKEKIASLSPEALDHIQGGQEDIGNSVKSSYHDFTCCACSHGMDPPVEEVN